MASTVLSIAGGAAFGPAGAFAFGLVGAGIDAYLFAPKQADTFGPRLEGAQEQKYSYGDTFKRLHGTVRIAGTPIWGEKFKEHEHTEEVGGKGGGGGSEHTTYTYTRSFAVGFLDTEGRTFAGVRKIWANTKLIYDASETATPEALYQNGQITEGIRVYTGTETQLIDPYIEAVDPDSPAFRGIPYIFFEDMDVTDIGGSTPIITAEWAEAGDSTTAFFRWKLLSSGSNLDPHDVGVRDGYVYYIGEVYADDEWEMVRRDFSGNLIDVRRNPPELAHLANFVNDTAVTAVGGASLIIGPSIIGAWVFCDFDTNRLKLVGSGLGGMVLKHFGNLTSTPTPDLPKVVGWDYFDDLVFVFLEYSDRDVYQVWDCSRLGLGNLEPDLLGEHEYTFTVHKPWYHRIKQVGTSTGVCCDEGGIYVKETNNDVTFYAFDTDWAIDEANPVTLGNLSSTGGFAIFGVGRGFVFTAASNYSFYGEQTTLSLQSIPLEDVNAARLQACGYVAADYDLTDLVNDDVRGFLLESQESTRASLEHLRRVYNYDLIEEDWKIVARKRGNASIVTIPYGDLATHLSGSGRPEPLAIDKTQDAELPRKLDFSYIDRASDYEVATQTESRQVTDSLKTEAIRSPVVLTNDEAKQTVSRIFWQRWEGRFAFPDISLPIKYAYLSPGDVVTLTDKQGDLHDVLLTEIELAGIMVRAKGLSYNPESATSEALGATTPASTRVFEWVGVDNFLFLDAPALSNTDSFGFYVAGGRVTGTFQGYALLRSNDGGTTYNTTVEAVTNGAIIGYANTTLGDGNPYVIDWSVSVTVNTYGQALSSVTELAMLNGENRALIGIDGRWEVIGFQNATLEADGDYTLTGLLRGLGGTEWAMDQHAAGDWFILLTDTTVYSVETVAAELNADTHYLPVRNGEQISEADPQVINNQSVRLMPLSPVHGKATYDGPGNLTVIWIKRTRYNGEWDDFTDVPLNEASEAYEVDVVESSVVVRTITSTASANGSVVTPASQQVLYDADDITADGVTSPFELYVYQLSESVGRGQPLIIQM